MIDVKAPLKCDRCHGPLDSISKIYSDEYDDYDIELVCSKCYDKHELGNLQERIKSLRSDIREKQKYLKCVKGGGHYFEEPEKTDDSLHHLKIINLWGNPHGYDFCTKCGYGDRPIFGIMGDNNLVNVGDLVFTPPVMESVTAV